MAHLDSDKVQFPERDFIRDDWHGRVTDFLCEIPFRLNGQEETIIICILLEHQSWPDWRMPLRTFLYSGYYWERQ